MNIPVNEPLLDGNEKKYLIECIDSGWISSEGPFVEKFEHEFASRVGRKYGVAVCNGTAAIDAAVEALGIRAGDEVILPAFTIISCIQQIVRLGAKPILVDSDPITWNMNVSEVEKKITLKTKAIMIVHIYGLPVDLDPILKLAEKYKVRVVEDSAEAIGQSYKGKPCGSFGDISTVSFYPNKHITTGEGGMILTDDFDLAEKCRSLRNLCFKERRFTHDRLGWNLRMTNMQAAVGLAQLERLDYFIGKKRKMGDIYNSGLVNIADYQLPAKKTDYADNIYWVYGLVIKEKTNKNAQQLIMDLGKKGVACRPFFYPMHRQQVFKELGFFVDEHYPVAEYLGEKGFYIPSGLALTQEQMNRVIDVVVQSESAQ
jgi:perosamine synthetase